MFRFMRLAGRKILTNAKVHRSWGSTSVIALLISIGLIAVSGPFMWAQNQTASASLSGAVTDPTGALVPGATVTLSSAEKGISRTYKTDNNGRYSFNLLTPTTYMLQIDAAGFEAYKQIGITLAVGQSASQDVVLHVGSAQQEVVVTSQAPLLNTANADLSSEVTGKQVVELPLNLRNVYGLATLNSSVRTGAVGHTSGSAIEADQDISFLNFGGGFFGTTAYLLDGIWDTASDWGAVIYVPSVDDVQEFRIQTNSFTAQYGWSTGNAINVITKSGGNAFHGDAFEFYRNSALDANSYFNNYYGNAKPDFDRHQFGASAGGPLYLPRIYQQREKTFIFGLYEGLRQSSPATFTGTVPTSAFRTGDFSALLGPATGTTDALGRPIFTGQIYNPYSTRQITAGQVDPTTGLVANSTGYIRDPFAGNNISSAITANGAALAKYYPDPTTGSITNNFSAAAASPVVSNEYTVRVDHNLSDASRLFGRWSQKYQTKTNSPAYYGATNPGGPGNTRPNNRYNLTFGYNHIFNSTTTMSLSAGYSRWVEGSNSQSYPFNQSSLGLPSFLDSTSPIFPLVNVEAQSGLGPFGGNQGAAIRNVGSISADFTKIIGMHSLSFGYMWVDLQNNYTNLPTTQFNFDHSFTAGPDPSASTSGTGYGFASLLLGTASFGTTANNFNPAVTKRYQGFYIQDDWRPIPKLTLNLGLRYEFQDPPTVRHDHQSYFNFTAPNPIGTEIGKTLPGTVVFNGGNNRRGLYSLSDTNVAPRLGFAYQATPKLVLRGGYGIFFAPQYFGGGPNPGYSQSTPLVSSLNGVTPYNTFTDPFPTGLRQPTGNSLGALQDVGFSTTAIPSDRNSPYIQERSVGLQYAFTPNDVLNVAYIGSHGTHLLMSGFNHSQLDPKYLSLGDALLNPVPNPFYGTIKSSGCGLDQATIPAGQALQPYPQYCSVNESGAPKGFSNYDALQVDYNHRFAAGLNLLVSYTYSKFIDNVEGTGDWAYTGNAGVRNYYDLSAETSVDGSDTPHSLVVSYIYEIPVGKGKKFGSHLGTVANSVVGGWQITGINTLRSGIPLGIVGGGNSNMFGGSQRPNVVGDPNAVHKTINEWFNTSAFAAPAPYTFGNVSRFLSNVRAPDFNNWDAGLDKSWILSESVRLQFRAEMFNAVNHANFTAPDTNLNDGAFGTIRGSYDPRSVQFAGKVYW